jgi:hypothetical protein
MHAVALLGSGIALYSGCILTFLIAYNEFNASSALHFVGSFGHHFFFVFLWFLAILPAAAAMLMYYLVFRGRVWALLLPMAIVGCAVVAQATDPENLGFLLVLLSVLILPAAVHHVIMIVAGRLPWRLRASPNNFPFSLKSEARSRRAQ